MKRDGMRAWCDGLPGEFTWVMRALRRDAGFSLGVILTVGTALAANALLFTFLSGYFLAPLPIPRAGDHVELTVRDVKGDNRSAFTLEQFAGIASGASEVVEGIYAAGDRRAVAVPLGAEEPVRAQGALVTPSYFALLRPAMALGQAPDGSGAPTVVLSQAGWVRLAGRRPDVVGQSMRIDGTIFTVTGVTAPEVTGLEPITPDFWADAATYESVVTGDAARSRPYYIIGGLLRAGVSAAAASAALGATVQALPPADAAAPALAAAHVVSRTTLVRERDELAPLVTLLLVAFGLMTLVACANLTGVYHARVAGRRRDFAMRFALGASRGRVARFVLLESLVLAIAGGLLGALLARVSIAPLQNHVFSLVIDAGLTLLPVDVDWRVWAYTMTLAVLIGAACALTPTLAALGLQPGTSRAVPSRLLRGGGRTHRSLQVLVVAQAAISLVLLLAGGMVVENATRAQRAETGLALGRLVDLGIDRADTARVESLRHDPRVAAVTTVAQVPLAGFNPRIDVVVDGRQQRVGFNLVDRHYFDVMAIPVMRGTTFGSGDAGDGVRRVVVSEGMARALWPGVDPVGRSLDVLEDAATGTTPVRYDVIGVVADVMTGLFFERIDRPMIYFSRAVASEEVGEVVVRMRTDAPTAADLRALCRAYAPGVLCRPMTLEALFARQQVPFTVAAQVASSLGAVTLALACIGLYGLVSFTVAQRTQEIGVRLAIGATRRDVLADVLLGATRRMAYGAAIGVPAAGALLALLGWQVPFFETFDLGVFLVAPALLVGAGILAALVPAHRASGVDPLVALRHE